VGRERGGENEGEEAVEYWLKGVVVFYGSCFWSKCERF